GIYKDFVGFRILKHDAADSLNCPTTSAWTLLPEDYFCDLRLGFCNGKNVLCSPSSALL
ncbi:hypothetical protein CEXT_23861, partial [Caerostris extrusa]